MSSHEPGLAATDPTDPLYRGVLAALGQRPSPARRRQIAARLRAEADRQDRLAAIVDEQRARPAAERVTPRRPQAGPGRAPAMFVRLERAEERRRGLLRHRLHIGRGLYYAIGSPARVTIQALGGAIRIAPGDEYAVIVGTGMPRVTCDGSADLLAGLADGRYAGAVAGGAIHVGARLPD